MDSERKVIAWVTDADTGEAYPLFNGDFIVRKSPRVVIGPDGGSKVQLSGGFVKLTDLFLETQMSKLSRSEMSIWLFLAQSMPFESQTARHKNNKPIREQSICKALGINEKTVDRALVSLKKRGLISKTQKGIVVNPKYARRGRYTNPETMSLFEVDSLSGED